MQINLAYAEILTQENQDKFAEEIAIHYQNAGKKAESLEFYTRIANHEQKECRFFKSIKLYRTMLSLISKTDRGSLLSTYRSLSKSYNALGKNENALVMCEKALLNIASDEQKWEVLSLKGKILLDQGKVDEAIKILQSLTENSEGIGQDHVAGAHLNLGVAYGQVGETFKEIHQYSLAAEHWKDDQGEISFPLTFALLNKGVCLSDMGEYQTAKDHFCRCLIIRRKLKGPSHLSVAIVEANLANALYREDRAEEGFDHIMNAGEIWNRCLHEDHPYLAFFHHIRVIICSAADNKERGASA